jgi:hypothetical protein
MSHIPNSAMPHAGPSQDQEEQGSMSGLSEMASNVMEKVRGAPRGAVAAGAAVAVGALAAAAIPLVKGALADRKSGGTKSRGKSGGAMKSA